MLAADAARARARDAFSAGNLEEAHLLFTSLLVSHPEDYLVLCNRSAVSLKLGRAMDAAADAKRATLLAPPGPQLLKAHYRHACALHAGAGSPAEAAQAVDKALEFGPDLAQLLDLRRQCEAAQLLEIEIAAAAPHRDTGMLKVAGNVSGSGDGVRVVLRRPARLSSSTAPKSPKTGATMASTLGLGTSSAVSAHCEWWHGWPRLSWLSWLTSWTTGRVRGLLAWAWGWDNTSSKPSMTECDPACHKLSGPGSSGPGGSVPCGSVPIGADPSSSHLDGVSLDGDPSSLPAELFDTTLQMLDVLQLCHCKCVSQAWARSVRRAASSRSARLFPATYSVTTSRRAGHPSQIWDEDVVVLEGAGTLTLEMDERLAEEGGALFGSIEECVVGHEMTSRAVGLWFATGRATVGWLAEARTGELGHGARSSQLLFELSLERANVSMFQQKWTFAGTHGSPGEDNHAVVQMEWTLLYC